MTKPHIINVAVGIIVRPDNRLLLSQRPIGKPLSGWWEFPGGKVESDETMSAALKRELQEEIGITVTEATPWVTYIHDYLDKTTRLEVWWVNAWVGEPQGLESQVLAWIKPAAAHSLGKLLPATWSVLRWLDLPASYSITSISGAEYPQIY